MISEVNALIKPTPVDNSYRLETYISQALTLKLQGKSLYSNHHYLEVILI